MSTSCLVCKFAIKLKVLNEAGALLIQNVEVK